MTSQAQPRGFTLMESVIAIGVVAILLTTFLAVFGPATQGIRRSISVQEANRLVSALERELQILRPDTDDGYDTAFDKAFEWIKESGDPAKTAAGGEALIFLYNYKGDLNKVPRSDGTMEPLTDAGGEPGRDYVLQPSVRRSGDILLKDDLEAAVGPIYFVKATQLVFENGALVLGTPGKIVDPYGGNDSDIATSADFPEAVIAFNAEIYLLRSNSERYATEIFDATDLEVLGRPLFTQNLAVRR